MDITTVQIETGGTMKQIFGSGGGDWEGMKVFCYFRGDMKVYFYLIIAKMSAY